jgi:hypothetical protein
MDTTAVTYVGLPIGSGASHKLARVGLREAHRRTQAFVDACMVEVAPRSHFFSFVQVPELPDIPDWAPRLWNRFGRGDGRRTYVADSDLDDAISFLEEVDPQPRNQWGMSPLWMFTNWKVSLLDPATAKPFPGQDPARYPRSGYEGLSLGESSIQLVLSNSAAVSANLCFPDLDDTRLREVLPTFQAHAPFKFSSKHWRRWTPTKTGSFRSKTITPI